MASKQAQFIHCMLIPLQEHYLLLPNSTIAEVIPRTGIDLNTPSPENWLGYVTWREQSLPIIHLEDILQAGTDAAASGNKLCIINSINTATGIEFYAIPCTGSPQLITLNQAALQLSHDANKSPYLHCQIRIGNKIAFIPDLDQLEMAIESQKQ
ncbi:Chemotaxis signal transduction protein [Methylophaga thiooxydans]|uniref:Chemotaxis signal transduction protein n=1 Tax=Methylophaga thiooxydans TaxID=392484 RepID=A0A0A0BIB8_9GAMM|nr:chemotaxis protein CheW [Methylophaga thiooxydans]KGM07630.1 Chemotaxis signal transduction protein [Methylophaga thiooxydans]